MREAKDAHHWESNVSQNRYLCMNDLKKLKNYTLHPLSRLSIHMGDSSCSADLPFKRTQIIQLGQ